MHLIRNAGLTLTMLYGVYLALLVVRVVGMSHGLSMLLFFFWAVSPLAALVGVRYKSVGTPGGVGDLLWFLALIALGAFGVVVYQEAFFGSRPESQSSLLLVFIPLYQWIGAAFVLLLLALVTRLVNRRHVT